LNSPPFQNIEHVASGRSGSFWQQFGAIDQIAPSLSIIIIGDFGLGSDAPIILNYAMDRDDPPVFRLCWSENGRGNKWLQCAAGFNDFAQLIFPDVSASSD
jgi:hypothetical protein